MKQSEQITTDIFKGLQKIASQYKCSVVYVEKPRIVDATAYRQIYEIRAFLE